MKRSRKLICTILAVVCLCMLGGWTSISDTTEYRYADVVAYSFYSTETVTFDTRDANAKINSAPQYAALSGMINACGAVAGAEIVGYYDKYYPDMIPGWQPFFPASGKFRMQDDVYIPSVMNDLYALMRTNVDDVGVSDSDFVNGLTQYINSKGFSVSMQNVVSGNSIDYSACKSAIDNSKVIALLSKPADLYIIGEQPTQDTISTYTLSGAHIMIAHGYKEVKYYNGNTLTRVDRYLAVSTGLREISAAYYKVNPHSLNKAYIVNIG